MIQKTFAGTVVVHIGSVLVALMLLAPPSAVQAAGQGATASPEAAVSRLSDQEVRDLLIKQLAAQRGAAAEADEEFNPAVIMYRFQRDAGGLRKELKGIFGAVAELPAVLPRAWREFSADRREGGLLWFVVALVVCMGLGGLAAAGVKSRMSAAIGTADAPPPVGIRAKAAILGSRFLVHMLCVVVFVAVAAAAYVLFFSEGRKDRIAFFFYLAASAIFMTAIALSTAFHAPGRPALRLPLYSDADARSLHATLLITVGFGAFAYFTCALMGTLGILGEVHELFLIMVGTITVGLLIYTIIAGRSAIAGDIAGDAAPNSGRGIFARLWPWIFAAVLVVLWVGIVVRELLYDFVPYGAALFTIGLMAVAPSVDALFARAALRRKDAGQEVEYTMARGARLLLAIAIIVSLSTAWRINPLAAGGGVGANVAGILLHVAVTCFVAYAAWQLARIFIDRKIAEEDALLLEQGIDPSESEMGGTGLSRTRTLLPLLKRTIQITLIAVSLMIVLGALGVDIAPLLAGAGVVGLAIGFGSQTLVKDIVSGAFFLMDDALRIGEYIDVGSVKGTVEKMSVRSVRLRHHRGAVHTVPFGEIKTLTNYSRDWAIMKLKFYVPFDTDVNKVRKLLKKVGLQLAENEEIKDDFIQPFKSQGAVEVNDYGFVISTKFMSKPGRQFFIRRFAFDAVQKAFQENGIKFATPKVEVSVEDADPDAPPAAAEEARPAGRAAAAAGADQALRAAKPAAQ